VLWLGAFTSSIGTWMQKVAQNWLVLTLSGSASAFYLGLDSFLGEVPILLFTLIGGVVADRRDRRQLLLLSQYVQMATALTLAALVYLDVVRVWHVLTLSVITGTAQAFGGPAISRSCLAHRQGTCRTHRAQLDSVQPRPAIDRSSRARSPPSEWPRASGPRALVSR
jgi:MFS family permease